MTDFTQLYPGRVRDITQRGPWVRDFYSERRRFKFRYYWHGVRVPWLAWVMFS